MKSVLKYQYVFDQRVVEGHDNWTFLLWTAYNDFTIWKLNKLGINYIWVIMENVNANVNGWSDYYMIVFVDKKFDVIQEWRLGYYIKEHIKDEYLIDCGSLIQTKDKKIMRYPIMNKYIFKQAHGLVSYTISEWMSIKRKFEMLFKTFQKSYVWFLMKDSSKEYSSYYLIIFTTGTYEIFKFLDLKCEEKIIIPSKTEIRRGVSMNLRFFEN